MDNLFQRRLIPSTSMLVAFDSAARTGSFTAAAEELNLTQGAVSRQIRALETQLDVMLFIRANKRVSLTEAGRAYSREIGIALKHIQSASLCVKTNPHTGLLNVAILPTFGTRWLMPRLPTFLDNNPGITVNFISKLVPFDLEGEGVHSAIHFGTSDWPGTDATLLMREELVPMASPSFLDQQPLNEPASLAKAPLLHLSSRAKAWFDWLSLADAEPSENRGLVFELFSTAAQAAVSGLGVALLPKLLFKNEIDRGELRIVFDIPAPTKSAYYLMAPHSSADYPPTNAFKEWLVEECRVER